MALDILMPKMGESVQEGTILRWLKQPGDTIERDEIIAEISTDKVDTEIPSPSAGTLLEIVAQENETVAVGAVIARLGQENEAATPAPAPAAPTPEPAAPAPVAATPAPAAAPATTSGSRTEILMPKMGESVQEGTILKWLKQPGDAIERDEIIAEISTDKVDTEIPSPSAGVLAEIVAQENATVPVGAVIAYLTSDAPATGATSAPATPTPTAQPVSTPTAPTNGAATAPVSAPVLVPAGEAGPIPRISNGKFYSPLVRSISEKEGISVAELDALQGSGGGGRVTKTDLLNYIGRRSTLISQKITQPMAQSQVKSAPTVVTQAGPDVEIVPMDRVRQLIAEHMVRSKQTSPHVSIVGQVDVTNLVRWREANKKDFEKKNGLKLTYTPIFIAAIAQALRNNPWVNASVEGTNVVVKKRVNIGMATALPDGNLIVPVIKDADRMNVVGLAHAVSDLADRARNKQLSPDDISGGTFTLTNYGMFGLLHGAPIINQPQTAILGTGAIQKMPVVRELDGQDVVVIRSMVYLSLSHDHRSIDGMLAGKFLSDIMKYLENFDGNNV